MTSPHDPRGQRPLPRHLDPRAGKAAGGGARRSIRVATITRVIAAVASVALLATGGWGWYLGRLADASLNRTNAIPTSGNDETVDTGEAMNMLLVGTDSRDDLTAAERKELHTGGDAGLNTDTMMLVHVPADGSKASFVSFPRDSYVDIPGHGQDKLNAAYAYGYSASDGDDAEKEAAGAQLLVQTISQLTGLQIDHYAEVNLLGFFNLSTIVGGVEVNLCNAVDDSAYSGAKFDAGVQTISGADAVKFVRQRHGLPRGDYDRIIRQQVYLAGIVRNIVSENVLLNPSKQRELVKAVADSMTVDQSLDLLDLAQQMQNISPADVDFQTVPYIGDAKDSAGRDIIQLKDEDTLHTFFANLSADDDSDDAAAASSSAAATATVAAGDVTVQVYNGSGTSGLASKAATELEAKGFVVSGTGNADSMSYTTTSIRYAEGDEALAKTLAKAIPGASTKQSDDATAGTVQLVLGSDFTAVGEKVASSSSAAASTTSATAGEDQRTADDTSCIN